jgi:hypothetical protein
MTERKARTTTKAKARATTKQKQKQTANGLTHLAI